MNNFFNRQLIESYQYKYRNANKVIDVAKKIYDAIDGGNNLNDDEKIGAVAIAILMLEDKYKNI